MKTNDMHELMSRRNGGIEVALRWHPETDSVSIRLVDDHTGEEHECQVPRAEALDAFTHPFAYVARAA
jgi:hypothetical protein